MSNHLRYRSGQVQLVRVAVEANTVIEPGDLLFLDSTSARSAADFVWDTNLATTQAGFADVFLGIAHERSTAGEDAPISVDVSPHSVYEFDADPTTYALGTLLGPDEDSTSMMNQQLETVAAATSAIARCLEFSSGSVSKVRVSFASAYSTGSANTNAVIG